jgi:hypothetical protein
MLNRGSWTLCVFLVVNALSALPAAAQYTYKTRIECNTAPVSGFKFADCWISNTFQNGTNLYQSWRLTHTDQLSQVAITYFKALNKGFYPVAHPDTIVGMFRSNSGIDGNIANVGRVMSVGNDKYFTFTRPERPEQRCQGFVRYGPLQNAGSVYRVVGFFCRVSKDDIGVDEAKFLTDTMQFR